MTTDALDLTCGSYIDTAFNTRAVLHRARVALDAIEYDTLVGRGVSGVVPLALLANEFDKKFAIVRKTDEDSHSSMEVEGYVGRRWVFVDDFIRFGTTLTVTKRAIDSQCETFKWNSVLVGAFLYDSKYEPVNWFVPTHRLGE